MLIDINDFTYSLPPERIASVPLQDRDGSKLLVYRSGKIENSSFNKIVSFLPENSFLFFNDTKVIPARLVFKKETGAGIEIFLLQPLQPSSFLDVMQSVSPCLWKCTIGNLKKWPPETTLNKTEDGIQLSAVLKDRDNGIVEFHWSPGKTFAEVLPAMGQTPLPPYIKRPADANDRERYQTIYSHFEGAVAAPTAGLHFTSAVFDQLKRREINSDFLTLHVSAGTFQPVKAANAFEHTMHREQIVVNRKNIENLLTGKFIVAVGTTSMRTLESLYWYGNSLVEDANAPFIIHQNDPYRDNEHRAGVDQALNAVLDKMNRDATDTLIGETAIYILPGYSFRICKGLITNFHQPGSTLILLVAAFIGHDWKKVYETALANDYRFLSYGDSSLLIP